MRAGPQDAQAFLEDDAHRVDEALARARVAVAVLRAAVRARFAHREAGAAGLARIALEAIPYLAHEPDPGRRIRHQRVDRLGRQYRQHVARVAVAKIEAHAA